MKAEDNRFPYLTITSTDTPPADPAATDLRVWADQLEDVVLVKTVEADGTTQPHWPIYVIPNGGTPPAGLAPHTIILEEGP